MQPSNAGGSHVSPCQRPASLLLVPLGNEPMIHTVHQSFCARAYQSRSSSGCTGAVFCLLFLADLVGGLNPTCCMPRRVHVDCRFLLQLLTSTFGPCQCCHLLLLHFFDGAGGQLRRLPTAWAEAALLQGWPAPWLSALAAHCCSCSCDVGFG